MDHAITWILENKSIIKHDALTIDKSAVDGDAGGYGIFADLSLIDDGKDERKVELLRIPRDATISMNMIREILTSDTRDKTLTSLKDHLAAFLTEESHQIYINETNIIVLFLIIKAIILNSEMSSPGSKDFASFYTDEVLLKTLVPLPVNKYQEDSHNWEHYYAEYMSFPQQQFIEVLEKFIQKRFPGEDHSKEIILIYCSVISRILEIPEAVEPGSDDYVVNPTLVPLLDFANHSNDKKNAYFDVDRNNNDIVLYLDLENSPESKLIQVFISYSPFEELVHFEQIYGFLPNSKKPQIFCYRFDENFMKHYVYKDVNVSKFYRCMNIRPYLEVVLKDDDVLLNDCIMEFAEIILPFSQHIKRSDLTPFNYNEDLKTYTSTIVNENGLEKQVNLTKEEAIEYIFGDQDETENYERTLKEWILHFLKEYINFRLSKMLQVKPDSETSSFNIFLTKELWILQKLKARLDKNQDITWYEKFGGGSSELPDVPFPPPCRIDYENLSRTEIQEYIGTD